MHVASSGPTFVVNSDCQNLGVPLPGVFTRWIIVSGWTILGPCSLRAHFMVVDQNSFPKMTVMKSMLFTHMCPYRPTETLADFQKKKPLQQPGIRSSVVLVAHKLKNVAAWPDLPTHQALWTQFTANGQVRKRNRMSINTSI